MSLLQRVAQGDAPAVQECVDAYGSMVWSLARRYLDNAGGEAEDAVQEVFLAVWLAASKFDPARGSEAAFIATLAHRKLLDYRRRVTSRRRRDALVRRNESSMVLTPPGPDRPEAQVAVAEFNRLPEDERCVVWLSLRHGMTHHQISEVTATPIGTVKSRIRRAFSRLAEHFDADRTTPAGTGGAA